MLKEKKESNAHFIPWNLSYWAFILQQECGLACVLRLDRVESRHPGRVPFTETLSKPLVSVWLRLGPESGVGSRPEGSWRQYSTQPPPLLVPSFPASFPACSLLITLVSRLGALAPLELVKIQGAKLSLECAAQGACES